MPVPAASRPPGSRGRSPSDRGRAQRRRGLRAALRRLRRPRRSGDGRQGHLGPAGRGLRRHRARDARRPPPRRGSRSPATSWSRSARRRCAPTAPCCRSRPTSARDDLLADPAEARPLGLHDRAGRVRRRADRQRRRADGAVLDRHASTSPRSPPRTSRACCACPRCRARCSSPPRSATTPPSSAARSSASPTSRASTSPSRAPSSTAASATSGLGSLRRLAELTAGDISFEDLERIIASDVGLSLKLLRYVNSRLLRAAAHRLAPCARR